MDLEGRVDYMFFEQLLEIETIANILNLGVTEVDLIIFNVASEKKLKARTYKLEVKPPP